MVIEDASMEDVENAPVGSSALLVTTIDGVLVGTLSMMKIEADNIPDPIWALADIRDPAHPIPVPNARALQESYAEMVGEGELKFVLVYP